MGKLFTQNFLSVWHLVRKLDFGLKTSNRRPLFQALGVTSTKQVASHLESLISYQFQSPSQFLLSFKVLELDWSRERELESKWASQTFHPPPWLHP